MKDWNLQSIGLFILSTKLLKPHIHFPAVKLHAIQKKNQCPSPPPFSYLSLELDRCFLNHNVETKLSYPICENTLVQEKKKKKIVHIPTEFQTQLNIQPSLVGWHSSMRPRTLTLLV